MKKSELKALLRPMIKECIKECILEEGVLSGIITEVVKGLNSSVITETKKTIPQTQSVNERMYRNIGIENSGGAKLEKLRTQKQRLMSAIGVETYGGVDLFEGTTPVPGQKSTGAQATSPLGGVDSNDAGVDISGIMAVGGNKWKSLI